MKKIIFLLVATLLIQQLVMAQPGDRRDKAEKIEQLKVAMLSQRLNLDSKTGERFWPIYNQYAAEKRNLIQQYKAEKKNGDDMDAADKLEKEQRMLDLKKKYMSQFSTVLSPAQVNSLFTAEKDFREMLMKRMQMKENREERGPRGDFNRGGDRRMNEGPRKARDMPREQQMENNR